MSWEQLAAIRRNADEEARRERAARPVACPIDGEPLDQGPDGRLHCPAGNWTEGDGC
jgi:hypothetical protein